MLSFFNHFIRPIKIIQFLSFFLFQYFNISCDNNNSNIIPEGIDSSIVTENGLLKKLNFDLKDQSINFLEPNSELYEIDINKEGKKEWLNIPLDKSHFTIYQEDFKNGLSFNFSNNKIKRIYFGIKKTTNGNNDFKSR